jgi:hypothetical protein
MTAVCGSNEPTVSPRGWDAGILGAMHLQRSVGYPAVVVRPLWSVEPELVDDGDRLAGRDSCVCGGCTSGAPWSALPAQPGHTQAR